jgi:hypothetical protein
MRAKLDLWLAICLVVLIVGTFLFMGTFVVALVVPPRVLPPLQALRFVTACIAFGAGILFLLSWLLFPLTDNWRVIRRFLAFGAGDDPAVDDPAVDRATEHCVVTLEGGGRALYHRIRQTTHSVEEWIYFCPACGQALVAGPEGGCSVNAVCKACHINYGDLPGYYGFGP